MSTNPMRVGLIGFGAIGRSVASLVELHAPHEISLVAALVREPERPREGSVPRLIDNVAAMIEARPEVVVEAGGHGALVAHAPAILGAGIDLILVSVGALANPGLEAELRDAAQRGNSRIRIVSGAIGALDAISAASLGGIDSVTHTTRKPARTLLPPAEAALLQEPIELFSGSARDAALRFPESVNVMAAVSLAGIGLDRTMARVIADPGIHTNQHEVRVDGQFGSLRFQISNVPSESNPKTGRIVSMSIVRQLLQRRENLLLG